MAGFTINNIFQVLGLTKSNSSLDNLPQMGGFGDASPSAYHNDPSHSFANLIPFDGEKTPFELGLAFDYRLDYYMLRKRAWAGFISTDLIQNTIKKYILWMVGTGLKLQYKPENLVIDNFGGIAVDENKRKIIESSFRLYTKTRSSTYSGEMNMHATAREALKNAMLAGDVLCVMRLIKGIVKIEIIDGDLVRNPLGKNENNGNKIEKGVEMDGKGSHVAYYVWNKDFKFDRIPAFGARSGRRMAWLFYGGRNKIRDARGMSLLTAVIESVNKLDRYKEATVGAAEENSKIPYTIEHNSASTGESPMTTQLAQAFGKGKGVAPETISNDANAIASKIAQTTNKQSYNMPIGASFKRHAGSSDSNFAAFFGVNSDIVYTTAGIPPEVANDKFGGSYSGSRAAIKSWEFKLFVDRESALQEQFYKYIFEFWLDVQVLSGNIDLPGYLPSFQRKNELLLAGYRNGKFTGVTVPHIDPVKEVKAERLKLGDKYKNIPLGTGDQSSENLNSGDFDEIIKQSKNELELAKDFVDDPAPPVGGDGTGTN